jgi:hypothetical protein
MHSAAQPGVEPGPPRSKRGMISVSPLSCVSNCDRSSGRHGIRTHMTCALRFSKPAQANRIRLPSVSVDRPGNRTPISWLQARCLPVGPAARIRNHHQRSVRESNPGPCLTKAACSRSTYRPHSRSSGSGGRTRRIELMRLEWALAHPQ